MDTQERLQILADASRYDLACACGTGDRDRRHRAPDGMWLYPVALPSGGFSVMLKTLMSSVCTNDCAYCPLRTGRDSRRCTLTPEEVAETLMEYTRRGQVFGLFLSSGVVGSPDATMERMVATARILRQKERYRGFIHLKVIPGASDAAIEEAMRLSNAVSLNIETPRRSSFAKICTTKDFDRDILGPLRRISEWAAPGGRFEKVRQTTQFLVGASDETDSDIVTATHRLYRRWGLQRIYYSAYQRGLGDPSLPGERPDGPPPADVLMREHRLYQVDWLLRKYGFSGDEIPFEADGSLSLDVDPKEAWARHHPERFPVDVNRAAHEDLLRVPGLGPTTVRRILETRRAGAFVRSIEDIGRPGKRLRKAGGYLRFS